MQVSFLIHSLRKDRALSPEPHPVEQKSKRWHQFEVGLLHHTVFVGLFLVELITVDIIHVDLIIVGLTPVDINDVEAILVQVTLCRP